MAVCENSRSLLDPIPRVLDGKKTLPSSVHTLQRYWKLVNMFVKEYSQSCTSERKVMAASSGAVLFLSIIHMLERGGVIHENVWGFLPVVLGCIRPQQPTRYNPDKDADPNSPILSGYRMQQHEDMKTTTRDSDPGFWSWLHRNDDSDDDCSGGNSGGGFSSDDLRDVDI